MAVVIRSRSAWHLHVCSIAALTAVVMHAAVVVAGAAPAADSLLAAC